MIPKALAHLSAAAIQLPQARLGSAVWRSNTSSCSVMPSHKLAEFWNLALE